MVYHYRKQGMIYASLFGEIQFEVPINIGTRARNFYAILFDFSEDP